MKKSLFPCEVRLRPTDLNRRKFDFDKFQHIMIAQPKTIDQKIDDLALAVKVGFDEVQKQFSGVQKQFSGVQKQFQSVNERLDTIDHRLKAVEMKMDRILDRQLDQHEHWIRQLAEKTGVVLTASPFTVRET